MPFNLSTHVWLSSVVTMDYTMMSMFHKFTVLNLNYSYNISQTLWLYHDVTHCVYLGYSYYNSQTHCCLCQLFKLRYSCCFICSSNLFFYIYGHFKKKIYGYTRINTLVECSNEKSSLIVEALAHLHFGVFLWFGIFSGTSTKFELIWVDLVVQISDKLHQQILVCIVFVTQLYYTFSSSKDFISWLSEETNYVVPLFSPI